MSGLLQDVRYTIRQLRKSRGFTRVAVIMIALGIGLNTAMFSLVNAVILRELPVDNAKQIVFPNILGPDRSRDDFAHREFEEIRDRSQSFSGVFAFDTTRFLASVDGQTDYVFGQWVSASFYSALGVKPILDRAFPSRDPMVTLRYE